MLCSPCEVFVTPKNLEFLSKNKLPFLANFYLFVKILIMMNITFHLREDCGLMHSGYTPLLKIDDIMYY